MRKPVIAGNWKMYKTLSEAVTTAVDLKPLVANANHCEVVIAPVFTAIKTVADRLEGSNVKVAGQNCATQNEFGAHTGDRTRDAQGCRLLTRDHWPFRKAAVLRRDR